MKKIFLSVLGIFCFSIVGLYGVANADYSEEYKRERLNSDQGKERKETYCDGECNDEDLISQNWEDGDRGLGKGGNVCLGIKLNTDFPIVGNCIELKKKEGGKGTNTLNAFSTMVGALIRIVTSIILIVCFALIIIAGIKRSSNDPKGARDLIKKVAITILLLGLSGVILRIINPTFFS